MTNLNCKQRRCIARWKCHWSLKIQVDILFSVIIKDELRHEVLWHWRCELSTTLLFFSQPQLRKLVLTCLGNGMGFASIFRLHNFHLSLFLQLYLSHSSSDIIVSEWVAFSFEFQIVKWMHRAKIDPLFVALYLLITMMIMVKLCETCSADLCLCFSRSHLIQCFPVFASTCRSMS